MMIPLMAETSFLINHPVFVRYKRALTLPPWRKREKLKSVFINERIIEIPYALQALTQRPPDARILDLGCTESVFPLNAATLGYRVTGLDFRAYPYRHPNLTVLRGDILTLPFADESFDTVTCISTLEHIGLGSYQDPRGQDADQRALAEIHRVLQREGLFILTVPFGRKAITPHQRIYDLPTLEALLQNFTLHEMKYFVNIKHPDRPGNHWEETNASTAGQIVSTDSVNAVCCLKAAKKAL